MGVVERLARLASVVLLMIALPFLGVGLVFSESSNELDRLAEDCARRRNGNR
jgi:hypothetical protein